MTDAESSIDDDHTKSLPDQDAGSFSDQVSSDLSSPDKVSDKKTSYSEQSAMRYEDTLAGWLKKSGKLSFIYDCVGDKYRKKIHVTNLVAFILTASVSLLALGNLGLTEEAYPNLTIALKCVNAVFCVASAIATGIPKLLGWQIMYDTCQGYIDQVKHLVAAVVSEQSVPYSHKTDLNQFIMEKKDKFLSVLNSAPRLHHDDYKEALMLYKRYMSEKAERAA